MGSVDIILEGDGSLQDWIDSAFHEGDPMTVSVDHYTMEKDEIRAVYLKGGMGSGLAACMIAARHAPGDEPVVIEMSARMLLSIAAAFKARAEYEGTPLQ